MNYKHVALNPSAKGWRKICKLPNPFLSSSNSNIGLGLAVFENEVGKIYRHRKCLQIFGEGFVFIIYLPK
jgi:hypothetical protein